MTALFLDTDIVPQQKTFEGLWNFSWNGKFASHLKVGVKDVLYSGILRVSVYRA